MVATKIIDFEKKGNVVKFYLGSKDLENWYGDDWDDAPYEHNAGKVYDQWIVGTCEIAFPYNYAVLEPQEEWRNQGNSSYCKDDMKARKVPCIVALKDADEDYWDTENEFGKIAANDNAIKFYFGDELEPSETLTIWKEKNERR